MYVCNYKSGNQNCDGCESCKKSRSYYCPVCGEEVYETIFVANDGEVIGCENCAQIKEPCDMMEDNDEEWRDDELEADYQ